VYVRQCGSLWQYARLCEAVHAAVCGSALGSVRKCARQCQALRQCSSVLQCCSVQPSALVCGSGVVCGSSAVVCGCAAGCACVAVGQFAAVW
jgi:hypothetical protein